MLLVIILLFATTVLAGAALTSRSNSATIGENAVDNVAAEWAAESAARVTEAIIGSQAEWLAQTGGDVLTSIEIAGATVDVTITTLEGDPPTGGEEVLLLTAIATVGKIEVRIEKVITVAPSVPSDPDVVLDEDLDEFAVFAATGVRISADSGIIPWTSSPGFHRPRPVNIGVGSDSAAAIDLTAGALVSDCVVYVNPTASSTLVDMTECDDFQGGAVLPFPVPVIPGYEPGSFESLPTATEEDLDINSDTGPVYLPTGGAYARLRVGDGQEVLIDGTNGTHYAFDEVQLRDQSILRISGDIKCRIDGHLDVEDGSTIVLERGSGAVIYVNGRVRVDDAAIGCDTAVANGASRSLSDLAAYSDPARLRLVCIDGDGSADVWRFSGNSIVCGVIRAPQSDVILDGGSIVVGRITGNLVWLMEGSTLAYDKSLDPGAGITNLDGMLYEDGEFASGLASAIAAYMLEHPEVGMGRWVRDWLETNDYPDAFAACDSAGVSVGELADNLLYVMGIERRAVSLIGAPVSIVIQGGAEGSVQGESHHNSAFVLVGGDDDGLGALGGGGDDDGGIAGDVPGDTW